MNYLHIAIIEAPEECLVSNTEEGLRNQVTGSLDKRSIAPLNNDEWAECVKGEYHCEREVDCIPFGTISYYKIESRL